MGQLVKKATDIKLHLNKINREEGVKLSKAWNPSTRSLKHSDADRLGKSQNDKHREDHGTKETK
jgi:hypothetical protein